MGKIFLVILIAVAWLGMIYAFINAATGRDKRFAKRPKWSKILSLCWTVVAICLTSVLLYCKIVYFDDIKPRDVKMKDVIRGNFSNE